MPTNEAKLETRCLSSLAKVFADEELKDELYERGSALANETYSFQVAYRSRELRKSIRIRIESGLKNVILVRSVGLAPSEYPYPSNGDGHILRTTPGLYPDPLYPLDASGLSAPPNQWRSVWITVELDGSVQEGLHPVRIIFETETGEMLGEALFELEVIPAFLPEQKLIHTEWFHTDCLAVYYGVDVFSEAHWQRIDQFLQTAVKHGMNMILTPLFTPPLDTAVGGERPTVQLVDVERTDGTYRFGFDKLQRWVELCSRRGMRYFEFSHFFTQWGAKHAPKIVARENGEIRKIFGWETEAAGEDYTRFLDQFLPALVGFIREHGLEERCYFHISDEPHTEHLESYRLASAIVRKHLSGYPIIDALSDYAFYEKGLVQRPIPASNHIEPFIENRVEPLWTYYCVSQYKDVSNRFFAMPSARNRVIGLQLYKFGVTGFLHWGYNFWFTQYSRRAIDPFRVTDAGCAFPSGDPFVVYPGEDGPIESLRLEVFYEALQDLRALQLLESRIGREAVIRVLEEGLDEPLTFRNYPRDAGWLLSVRERVNRFIRKHGGETAES